MSDSKTKPKTREKPTTAAHAVKNAPKTVKSVPYNVLRNAQSVIKEQLIKQTSEKLSKIQQNGQTEQTPENYATDSVENAAYSTAAKVYLTTRTIAEHRIRPYRAQKIKTKENHTMPDIPVNPTATDNIPKLASNQPKTLQLTDGKIPPNSGGIKNPPKTVNKNPKTIESMKLPPKLVGSQSKLEISRNLRRISPKTKETYTAAQENASSSVTSTPKQKAIQQAKAKAQQKAEIKTKKNYVKNHSADIDIKTPDTARRDYVRDKLKAKSEKQKALHITDAEMPKTEKADVIPDKPNIKTKESYMQSLRNDKIEPVKSAYKNVTVPKQKSGIVSRQMQSASKAVHSKQKMTSKTVKDSRNVFKASRVAKKKVQRRGKLLSKHKNGLLSKPRSKRRKWRKKRHSGAHRWQKQQRVLQSKQRSRLHRQLSEQ